MTETINEVKNLLKKRKSKIQNLKDEKQEKQETLHQKLDEFFFNLEKEFKVFLTLLPEIKDVTEYKNSFVAEIPNTDFIVVMYDSKLSKEYKSMNYKDKKKQFSMSFYDKNSEGNTKDKYYGIRLKECGEHHFGYYELEKKFYAREIINYEKLEEWEFELMVKISKNINKIKSGLEEVISSLGLKEITLLEEENKKEVQKIEKMLGIL